MALTLRLTDQEQAKLDQLVEKSSINTASGYIKHLLVEHEKTTDRLKELSIELFELRQENQRNKNLVYRFKSVIKDILET